MSNQTSQDIDGEIRKLVDDAYVYATKTLKKNHKLLCDIAENLLEYETLSGDEINLIIAGKKVDRSEPKKDSSIKPRSSTPMAGAKTTKEPKVKTATPSKKKVPAKTDKKEPKKPEGPKTKKASPKKTDK